MGGFSFLTPSLSPSSLQTPAIFTYICASEAQSIPSAPPVLELEAAGPQMVDIICKGGGQEEHSSFCELTRDTQGPEDACKKPGRLKASIGRIRELLCTAYVYQE